MIKTITLNPYPRKMWVAKDENFDKLKEIFTFNCEDDLVETHQEVIDTYNALVLNVSKDELAGYLVFICPGYKDEHLVHEAVHVALSLYKDCYLEVKPDMDQEPLAYLIEYIYTELTKI